MKKRTAFVGAILSLIPLGQPLLIKTGMVLSSSALMLSLPEKVNAESADFYFDRGNFKLKLKNNYGAISDYTKAIEINPQKDEAYNNRAVIKGKIGDLNGACADWSKASSLGNDLANKSLRNQC